MRWQCFISIYLVSLNTHFHASLRRVPIRSMQDVLVTLQYERASSYSISIKYGFRNFTLWIPLPWVHVPVAIAHSARP